MVILSRKLAKNISFYSVFLPDIWIRLMTGVLKRYLKHNNISLESSLFTFDVHKEDVI